jgi:multiple antibiotic resistance protein
LRESSRVETAPRDWPTPPRQRWPCWSFWLSPRWWEQECCTIFGVSLDAFSVAGGGVLAWIGFSMLRSNSAPTQDSSKEGADEKRSITPLILFAASPGTITGVITLAVAHAKLELPVTALVAVAVATGVMWIVMILMARGGTHERGGFWRETATQFMGLIVVAMGVQFALTGIRSFFHVQP